jgi:methionyl-tRNA synthetase
VKVPDNPNQVVYVWIDALINYLSGQGYGTDEGWKDIWNKGTKKIHVIGKNVWKFHAIYWPALLLSAGLPLPNEILIHGFLTVDGEKISKSLGNGIDPRQITDNLSSDALRNYLVFHLSQFQDADFSLKRLKEAFNRDFANNLGNLVSRLAAISNKASLDIRVDSIEKCSTHLLSEVLSDYDLQKFSQGLWNRVSQINAEVNQTQPWRLIKSHDHAVVKGLLIKWVHELYEVSELLSCFLPATGEKIKKALSSGLQGNRTPLFPRIETST